MGKDSSLGLLTEISGTIWLADTPAAAAGRQRQSTFRYNENSSLPLRHTITH
jgi:hypothetical protein